LTTELKLLISRSLTVGSFWLLMITIAVHLWLQSQPWIAYVVSLLPLALFIPGIVADRLRTLIWLGFVVLIYFYVGISNMSVPEPALLDKVELGLSIILFCAAMVYARTRQVNNLS